MRAMVAFRISRGVTSPRRISAARARASWSSSRASIDKGCSVGLRSLSERFAGLADARARFLQRLGRGRVGHPEVRRQAEGQIGRAHVWTPVTNAHLVCRLLLEKKNK